MLIAVIDADRCLGIAEYNMARAMAESTANKDMRYQNHSYFLVRLSVMRIIRPFITLHPITGARGARVGDGTVYSGAPSHEGHGWFASLENLGWRLNLNGDDDQY